MMMKTKNARLQFGWHVARKKILELKNRMSLQSLIGIEVKTFVGVVFPPQFFKEAPFSVSRPSHGLSSQNCVNGTGQVRAYMLVNCTWLWVAVKPVSFSLENDLQKSLSDSLGKLGGGGIEWKTKKCKINSFSNRFQRGIKLYLNVQHVFVFRFLCHQLIWHIFSHLPLLTPMLWYCYWIFVVVVICKLCLTKPLQRWISICLTFIDCYFHHFCQQTLVCSFYTQIYNMLVVWQMRKYFQFLRTNN